MKRNYNTRKIKGNWSYSIDELASLFGVHPATVRDWIKKGLPTIDKQRPFLMHGPATRQWLENRQKARSWPREYGKLPCFTCKSQRKIIFGSFQILSSNTRKIKIQGQCVTCKRPIGRGDTKANEAKLIQEFCANPSED